MAGLSLQLSLLFHCFKSASLTLFFNLFPPSSILYFSVYLLPHSLFLFDLFFVFFCCWLPRFFKIISFPFSSPFCLFIFTVPSIFVQRFIMFSYCINSMASEEPLDPSTVVTRDDPGWKFCRPADCFHIFYTYNWFIIPNIWFPLFTCYTIHCFTYHIFGLPPR